jgi:hypothetical protein
LLGIGIGTTIGQDYDGTLLPFATGFFLCALASLAIVLVVEKGRPFKPQLRQFHIACDGTAGPYRRHRLVPLWILAIRPLLTNPFWLELWPAYDLIRGDLPMIEGRFDARTLANMNVALAIIGGNPRSWPARSRVALSMFG